MAALADHKPEGFEVWAENMPIVDAFQAIASQWRALSMADGRVLWLGLDYPAVRAGLEYASIVLSPEQWTGLQVMERVAGAALNGVRS